jgi:hypothetical protein
VVGGGEEVGGAEEGAGRRELRVAGVNSNLRDRNVKLESHERGWVKAVGEVRRVIGMLAVEDAKLGEVLE